MRKVASAGAKQGPALGASVDSAGAKQGSALGTQAAPRAKQGSALGAQAAPRDGPPRALPRRLVSGKQTWRARAGLSQRPWLTLSWRTCGAPRLEALLGTWKQRESGVVVLCTSQTLVTFRMDVSTGSAMRAHLLTRVYV